MQHQVFGADRGRAIQLAAKRDNRLFAHHRIERGQIDQVVGVDRERRQIELLPRRAEALHVHRVRDAARHIRGLAEKI